MFSLLPPSLLRSLSDAFISHFIMDTDERLRFTIVITQQTIYWKGGQMAKVLSTPGQRTRRASRRCRDPPAIIGNSVANYGVAGNWVTGYDIGGNAVAGYALPTIPLLITVEISPNICDYCMFQ
jgi:hypothetical protein